MRKQQSVISFDPISAQKNDGIISRFLKTRRFGGKSPKKEDAFGMYIFAGSQGSGKTTSAIWYAEMLKAKYEKNKNKVIIFSNMGFGKLITKKDIHNLIQSVEYNPNTVYIILLDEFQSYYPKDSKNKQLLDEIDLLVGDFSQLRKRRMYVLATAQIYGRINKSLREQCLYMVNCKIKGIFRKRCVNDFIAGDDILCDDLGRWSGVPRFIYKHGLPKSQFDSHKLIKF